MLLNNYSVRNHKQNRTVGGNLDPTYNLNYAKMRTFYVSDNGVSGVTEKVSFPESGMRPPYSLVLPPDTGGMSSLNTARVSTTATADGEMGVYIDSLATVTVTAEATLQLVASLIGTAAVAVTSNADLKGIAGLEGTSAVAVSGTADIFGTGRLLTSTPVAVTGTADIFATGSMHSLVYLNQSQATVDQIVTGVVENLGTITATVPNLMTEDGVLIVPLD